MVTEKFREQVLRYRLRGQPLYRLAIQHGLSPSLFSATLTGARRCDYDPRIIAIGEFLGLKPEEVFEPDEETVAP